MPQFRPAVAAAALLTLAAATLPAQQLPRKAGEWNVLTVDGTPLLLSSYKGKVVVLAFILTTCPHCQKTIGILSKLQPEYKARGVQVIASAVQDGAKNAIPDFVKTFQPTFPVGYNNGDMKLLDFWQIAPAAMPMMPIVILVDRQGNVRSEHQGRDEAFFGEQQEQNFRREIEGLLKK